MTRRRREHLAAPEPLEAILHRAGENRFARVRPPIPSAVWRDAVGARIAERATPTFLSGGLLVLRVGSSVWGHELSLLAEDVCARLRERGVAVREADADLRATIAKAATSNLAWQAATSPPEQEEISEVRRAARAPRSAAGENALPDRTKLACREGPPSTRGNGRDRSY